MAEQQNTATAKGNFVPSGRLRITRDHLKTFVGEHLVDESATVVGLEKKS
jgi:hypothetical protein